MTQNLDQAIEALARAATEIRIAIAEIRSGKIPVAEVKKDLKPKTLLSDAGISTRLLTCLYNHNMATVGDLVATPDFELSKIRNFGRVSLAEAKLTKQRMVGSVSALIRARKRAEDRSVKDVARARSAWDKYDTGGMVYTNKRKTRGVRYSSGTYLLLRANKTGIGPDMQQVGSTKITDQALSFLANGATPRTE